MESGVSSALALGAEAVQKLDKLLQDKQVAKAWYGDHYDVFTFHSPILFWRSRWISRVFIIDKSEWKGVIRKCLEDCHRWIPNDNGECSWLHIYRAISETRQKSSRWRRFSGRQDIPYTKKTAHYLSYIGSISSLPTANLDSRGLIVLALADGAKVDFTPTERGGFAASLEGRDFILTIQRHNIVTTMTGHLEPRDHPEQDNKLISDYKWINLLWYGHTYDDNDPIMSWYDIDEDGEPPDEIIDRKRDSELKNTVIDHYTRNKIAEKLRKWIHVCYQAWDEQKSSDKVSALQLREIKSNLKKKKVILCDEKGADYALEQTPGDVLEYAQKQLDIAQVLATHHGQRELLQKQKRVYALTKFLIIPQILAKDLSTKGRGISIALA